MNKIEPLGNGVRIYVSDQHHFTTDTILLAHFANAKTSDKAIDLGAGCGTIPLLWTRENTPKEIAAVELQKDAVSLLQDSISLNLENGIARVRSITPICADLRDLKGKLPFGYFTLVTCNPPYKPEGTGLKNPDESKTTARHETDCTVDDVCKAASQLLQFAGRFCLCLRPERLCDVTEALRKYDLEPKRLRFVQQRSDKAPKLFLLEARRGSKKGFLTVEPVLFIEDDKGGFSKEMKAIYGSYKEEYL